MNHSMAKRCRFLADMAQLVVAKSARLSLKRLTAVLARRARIPSLRDLSPIYSCCKPYYESCSYPSLTGSMSLAVFYR